MLPTSPYRRHRRARARFRAAAAFVAVLGAPCTPAAALESGGNGAGGVTTIRAAVPAGFNHLLAPQRGVVDVWFGGKRVGQVEAVFAPGAFRFVDAAAVAPLLPDVTDRGRVAAALAASLDPHAARVCAAGEVPECGRLDPDVAGVIFDTARFRVDVFVNPKLRAVRTADGPRYLSRPAPGLSLIDAVGVAVAGTSGETPIYNIENRAIIGDGTARLRSDVSWTSSYGLRSDVLAAELDRRDIRYSAGSFWAPGVELTGRRKVLGLAVETQLDTRLDRDLIQASPLIVFLQQRAQVDIVRDGRLLVSRIYDAGNQSIDTSGLPDGAYDVVLRIREADGTIREERRFYSRMRRIAPLGRSLVAAYVGMLTRDRAGALIGASGSPFAEASYARRLNPGFALDVTLLATNHRALGQIGADILTRPAQLHLAALAGATGEVGLLGQLASTGLGPLAVNFDARVISSRHDGPLLPDTATPAFPTDNNVTGLATGSYAQFDGSLSYLLGDAQLSLLGTYRRQTGQRAYYAVGPSVRWPFLHRDGLEIAFSGDLSVSERARTAFAGISIRRQSRHGSIGASTGMRSISDSADLHGGAVDSVDATWQEDRVLGGTLDSAASVARDPDGTIATGNAVLRTSDGSGSVDIAHRFEGAAGTQYGLALRTGFANGGGKIELQAGDGEASAVMVRVAGAPADSSFDILVDESPRATIAGSGTAAITLPAYREYDVRLRARNGDMLQYDGSQRRVSLYPGNVVALEWAASRVAAQFGRARWPDGNPVADADVVAGSNIARTDSQGYFLITAAAASSLTFATPDGRHCATRLSGVAPVDGYAALGDITCQPTAPTTIVAALSPEKTP